MHKILIIPNLIHEPTLVGVYNEENSLLQEHSIVMPLSDGLVPKFMEFEENGIGFDSLYYVRGPGSFMALKLIYLFARTLEITKGIQLYATEAFSFNQNSPIKAYGNCYFVKDKECALGITLEKFLEAPKIIPFSLPSQLEISLFGQDLEPLYLLPAV